MQSLVNFFGRRRFNYIDLIGIFLFVNLWEARQYVVAIAFFVAFILVSFTVENRAE